MLPLAHQDTMYCGCMKAEFHIWNVFHLEDVCEKACLWDPMGKTSINLDFSGLAGFRPIDRGV